eukprot:4346007-Prymnesium_polylepis.1
MLQLYVTKPKQLKLEFAAILDMRTIVSVTYEMEGDGLPQLLVFSRVEALRVHGRTLDSTGALRNVEAVLRDSFGLAVGVKINKVWPGHGVCEGIIISIDQADSTLYPGQVRTVYTVKYVVDDTEEDLEEDEIRPLLDVSALPERAAIVSCLTPGFEYLHARLTGNCQANFSCEHPYNLFRLFQAFDPGFAATSITQPFVESMAAITAIGAHGLIPEMVKELPAYLTAAVTCTGFNRAEVREYTEGILKWWRINHPALPAWAKAARICFAILPSSAPSERVFSLVKSMFGDEQLSSLADQIQAAVMLNYNKRAIG